jgi:hypothetical protein
MANPGFVANAVEVRIHWSDPSRAFLNVMHMQYTTAGPLNPNVAQTISTSIEGSPGLADWLGFCAATTSYVGVDVRDLRSPNEPLISSTTTSTPGTSPDTALAPQTALVVTLRTAKAGRAFRGRVYLGGMALNATDGTGKIAAAANTAGIGMVNAVAAGMVASGGTIALLQKWLPARTNVAGDAVPERQPDIVPITGYVTVDNIFDTQRRRTGARIGSR